MTMRFHVRTDDAIRAVAEDPTGQPIPDSVTVKAGLGTAWRPPADADLVSCAWTTPAAGEREFALPLSPVAQSLGAGVYRVWFRLDLAGSHPLVRIDEPVVLFGVA